MKYCTKCGNEMVDEAVVCPNCGCPVESPYPATTAYRAPVVDEVNIGLCVLSFFVPIFGVIYWPVKHRETPKRAQACGVAGIVGWILNLFFLILI